MFLLSSSLMSQVCYEHSVLRKINYLPLWTQFHTISLLFICSRVCSKRSHHLYLGHFELFWSCWLQRIPHVIVLLSVMSIASYTFYRGMCLCLPFQGWVEDLLDRRLYGIPPTHTESTARKSIFTEEKNKKGKGWKNKVIWEIFDLL